MGQLHYIPADPRHCPNVVLMLVHRRRRWTNIKTASGWRFVFAGMGSCTPACIQMTYYIRHDLWPTWQWVLHSSPYRIAYMQIRQLWRSVPLTYDTLLIKDKFSHYQLVRELWLTRATWLCACYYSEGAEHYYNNGVRERTMDSGEARLGNLSPTHLPTVEQTTLV